MLRFISFRRLVLHQEAITLGACLRTFEELLEEYLTEYRFYELDQLAAGIVCPIVIISHGKFVFAAHDLDDKFLP